MGSSESKLLGFPTICSDVSVHIQTKGGIRVICSPSITGTDLGTVALIISSFTTAEDLVTMVIAKCKVTNINSGDYCVVMETGYKDKDGGLNTTILNGDDNPLEMQAQKPKGQARFGVQPRNGVVVKVYDGRDWPVTVFGDVYITSEFNTQLVIHHLLSSSTPKKRLTKYTLALGSSHGKIHRFLNDVEKPVRVLQDPKFASGEDICFLIVKKPKPSKKQMFRSLSWASVNKPVESGPMNQLDGTYHADTRKHKKYRLKKKKDAKIHPNGTHGNCDSTSSEETIPPPLANHMTSTPIKKVNSAPPGGRSNNNNGTATTVKPLVLNEQVNENDKKGRQFSLSGMPQKSSLTSFYSCDDIHTIVQHSSDSDSEMSSTEIVEERSRPQPRSQQQQQQCTQQPPQYQQRQPPNPIPEDHQECEDTLSDLQVVLRTRSLGDLSSNHGLSLPVSASVNGTQEGWRNSDSQAVYNGSVTPRTVTVNQPVTKHDVPRQRPSRHNRRSCVARIEDKENRDYLEDAYGRSLQKTPRQRRSLPQIPNNDIDEKKRRFAELVMRRLTVCSGEIANYYDESSHHLTGSLNEIRDGRYISNAHIHLTPKNSLNSQPDISPSSASDKEFENGNYYHQQRSPVEIISSPRSPQSLSQGSCSYLRQQSNIRRRTPDPFNDSPRLNNYMPIIQEREPSHTPLSRIASSELRQPIHVPRSRVAISEPLKQENGYHSNNHVGYPGNKQENRGYHGNKVEHGSYPVNKYGTLPHNPGNPKTFYVESHDDSGSQFSTFPRSDKSGGSHAHRVPTVISPGKPSSDNGSDSGGQTHVTSRGSMVDSGYGTNGESDYGMLPLRPNQFHPATVALAGYVKDRPLRVEGVKSQGIIKRHSNEFVKFSNMDGGSSGQNSIESPPDPAHVNPPPSLHQLLGACNIHAIRLSVPRTRNLSEFFTLMEDSISLPAQCNSQKSPASDSPKGKYARGLGGPGSAFRRVRNPVKEMKSYTLVSVDWITDTCQPREGHILLEKGDFLIEVNGHSMLDWDYSTVLSMLESQQGGQLEVVIARKKPVERAQETLTNEISKLRQQCSYLINEVRSKEQIITDLSLVSPGESSPRQKQSLILDPPINRQEAYYTCELSEDEFIV